jgi:hypothetical protein
MIQVSQITYYGAIALGIKAISGPGDDLEPVITVMRS